MNKMYESKWTLCWEIKWGFLLKKYISFKKSRSCETDLVPTKRLTDSRIILRVSSTNKVCVIKKKFYKIFWNPFGARRDDLSLFWWFYWLKTRNDGLTILTPKITVFLFWQFRHIQYSFCTWYHWFFWFIRTTIKLNWSIDLFGIYTNTALYNSIPASKSKRVVAYSH